MAVEIDPPFAVPQPLGYTLDGDPPTADDPAAMPAALVATLDGSPLDADDPLAVPSGGAARITGVKAFTITSPGDPGDPDTLPDPIPADKWTLSFRGGVVGVYTVLDGDANADVAQAIAALVEEAELEALRATVSGVVVTTYVQNWPFDGTSIPSLAHSGTVDSGAFTGATGGQVDSVVRPPDAVPQNPLVTTVDGDLVDWLSPEPTPGGPTL